MGEAAQTRTPETQLFHDVFNASPIGIAVETLEGQPLFVNPSFCSFLGFSEEELRNKHCVDFSPREDAEKDWALFQQLRASSIDHYQLKKRYFRRDGSLVWGSLSISLLKSSPSPLVLAMVEDITDKKKAEEARYRHAAIVESPHPLKYFVLLIHWGRAKKINRFAASLKVPMLEICNLGLFETPPTRWWYMSYLAQTGS